MRHIIALLLLLVLCTAARAAVEGADAPPALTWAEVRTASVPARSPEPPFWVANPPEAGDYLAAFQQDEELQGVSTHGDGTSLFAFEEQRMLVVAPGSLRAPAGHHSLCLRLTSACKLVTAPCPTEEDPSFSSVRVAQDGTLYTLDKQGKALHFSSGEDGDFSCAPSPREQ